MDLNRVSSFMARQSFLVAKEEEFCQEYKEKCVPGNYDPGNYCCVSFGCEYDGHLKDYFCKCDSGYTPSGDPDEPCVFKSYDYIMYITFGVLGIFVFCCFTRQLLAFMIKRRTKQLERTVAPASAPYNFAEERDFEHNATAPDEGPEIRFENFTTSARTSNVNEHFSQVPAVDEDKPPSYESVVKLNYE